MSPLPRKRNSRNDKPRKAAGKTPHKYIFVIGGVMSGVGKGIATSSVGMLLSTCGYSVNLVKVDPYLNVDAGTMNPTEHGEVFVMNSGLETDQDMGNYERFLNRDLSDADYMTSGMVYRSVIDRERALGYGGKCVEALPHIRDEIIGRWRKASADSKSDISVVEIGGTVGDFQNALFIEAARVMHLENPGDVVFVMVSYLPVPGTLGEMKTKPTQTALHMLNSYGIQADFVIARSAKPIDGKRKEKLSFICNVRPDGVISAPDIESIYDVPVNFERDKLGEKLLDALHLPRRHPGKSFLAWKKMAEGVKNHGHKEVHIAVVGKYFNTGDFILSDSYLSVIEAVKFSACAAGVKAIIHTVNARDFEPRNNGQGSMRQGKGSSVKGQDGDSAPDDPYSALRDLDGIIVPGGFGETGIEGKLAVIRYARENDIPYFGLCYGMQLMTIEYARNVLGLEGAQTAEIDPTARHIIIDIMPDQKELLSDGKYGASMRLGLYPALVRKDTVAFAAYEAAGWPARSVASAPARRGGRGKAGTIAERHRHRYEVNPEYIERLEAAGLVFSGRSPDGRLMEIAELPRKVHPFFLGTQFHPEFLARPLSPHPLFTAFIEAAKSKSRSRKNNQ